MAVDTSRPLTEEQFKRLLELIIFAADRRVNMEWLQDQGALDNNKETFKKLVESAREALVVKPASPEDSDALNP